ncbi:MAG TPA: ROK family protein [Balneolaceae bacterium]|nr:ROK family protein [Balneolaceae bacterium]
MALTDEWAIGVDLGGTKIEAAHVDQNGSIQNRKRVETHVSGGAEEIQKQIQKLAKSLIENASSDPISLGIGVAGQIDKETGAVSYAPNLNWKNVALDVNLENQLSIPVTVLNDVRAAAWGEWLHGAGKGLNHTICIFIGTGIGGGIVSEGSMLSGASNTAGEIGHMTVQLNGPECHCGNYGCLEALAGSWAIERDAREAINNESNKETLILEMAGGNVADVKAKHVLKAYEKDDELAQEIIGNVVNALAGGLTGLTNALNPERIIMGGGVTEHLSDLIPMVEKKVRKRILDAAVKPLEIVPTDLDGDSGVIGAAAYTFRKEKKNT